MTTTTTPALNDICVCCSGAGCGRCGNTGRTGGVTTPRATRGQEKP
jgi:hypothetical protein